VQFTSNEYVERLKQAKVRIRWDGRGRALDNIFVERLWRSVKYEEVFIKDYRSVMDARKGLQEYFQFYNHERIHQSLEYKTPAQVYLR
jgi:putative transposase